MPLFCNVWQCERRRSTVSTACHQAEIFVEKRKGRYAQKRRYRNINYTKLILSTKKCAENEIPSTNNLRLTPRTSVNAHLRSHRCPKIQQQDKRKWRPLRFGWHSQHFLYPVAYAPKNYLSPIGSRVITDNSGLPNQPIIQSVCQSVLGKIGA